MKSSVALIKLSDYDMRGKYEASNSISALKGDIYGVFIFERFINISDVNAKPSPEYLPHHIEERFKEGTRCLAFGAYNAAASMFRLCLDMATKDLVTEARFAEELEMPTKKQTNRLADRLDWLFDNGLIAPDLRDLAGVVRQDGNDGAHDGTLTEHDSEDLYDFAYTLLGRLYTDPARVQEAKERQKARRAINKQARA
jgi:hypothetical protein